MADELRPDRDGTAAGADLLIRSDVDEYQGEPIVRVLVAGLTAIRRRRRASIRLPGPGEAVVSPALAALMKDVPADQLGDRIGTVVGTVGDAGLRSPDELVAIVGLDSADPGRAGRVADHRLRHDAADARHPADRDPDDRAGGHRCAGPGGGLRLDRDPTVRRAARAAACRTPPGRCHGLAGDAPGRRRGAVRDDHRRRRGDRAVSPGPPVGREDPARQRDVVPGVDRAAAPAGDRACCC